MSYEAILCFLKHVLLLPLETHCGNENWSRGSSFPLNAKNVSSYGALLPNNLIFPHFSNSIVYFWAMEMPEREREGERDHG